MYSLPAPVFRDVLGGPADEGAACRAHEQYAHGGVHHRPRFDLGTQGASDADISLRKCIKHGLIPGPRYYCANRTIMSPGSYGPKGATHVNQEGIDGVTGAEAADGVDECTKVIRRQIGAGADSIKIYTDSRVLPRMSASSSPSLAKLSFPMFPTFSTAEMQAIISTAHSAEIQPQDYTQRMRMRLAPRIALLRRRDAP
ncbi:hypothetical protein EYR38_000017 [Pleurotus pulmonarius]|nr:hypothetical protein EYR38_000017 [Pleurotus pulmonarius]